MAVSMLLSMAWEFQRSHLADNAPVTESRQSHASRERGLEDQCTTSPPLTGRRATAPPASGGGGYRVWRRGMGAKITTEILRHAVYTSWSGWTGPSVRAESFSRVWSCRWSGRAGP